MKKITKQTYLDWYKDMLFWRKFEDKLASVYIQQKVRGFLHLYNGQEAILAGALHAMDLTKDKMITAYRNHVQPIGMGVDPKRVMAELYGKVTGTSKGMGGSMHLYDPDVGFQGSVPIVGGTIPIAVGAALACLRYPAVLCARFSSSSSVFACEETKSDASFSRPCGTKPRSTSSFKVLARFSTAI